MAQMTEQTLDNALATLDPDACIHFFDALNEKDRKTFAARATDWLDVCTLHNINDWELNFWLGANSNPVTAAVFGAGDKPTKRVERLTAQVKEAKEKAKSMPPQAVRPEALAVAQLAVMATSTLTELKKRKVIPKPEHCYSILVKRRPKWLTEWIDWVTSVCPHTHWETVRKLEREGVIDIEPSSNYLYGMALHLAGTENPFRLGWQREHMLEAAQENPIAERLLADPELFERVWLMFNDDHSMRTMLHTVPQPTGRDGWSPENQQLFQLKQALAPRWRAALLKLSREGHIDQRRLLTSLMTVFARFNLEHSDSGSSLDIGWYTELHDKCLPSMETQKELLPDYIRLLNCRNSKVIAWAVDSINKLAEEKDFPVERVCDSLSIVFLLKGKEHSAQALKLLKNIADNHKDQIALIAYTSSNGLDSENQEVQKRTMVLLEKLKYRDDQLVASVRSKIQSVAVVHRDRVVDWLGEDASSSSTSSNSAAQGRDLGTKDPGNVVALRPGISTAEPQEDWLADCERRAKDVNSELAKYANVDSLTSAANDPTAEITETNFLGNEIPRLNPDALLPVVTSLDELIFLCSELLHGEWNAVYSADSVEIVLDGIARFGTERPADFGIRTDAIRAQAMHVVHDPLGSGVTTWLTGNSQVLNEAIRKLVFGQDGDMDILRERFHYVATKAHEQQRIALLATPTHKGGWIDPLVLVQRASENREAGRTPGRSLFAGVMNAFGLNQEQPLVVDQCLALLRLAPENRKEALVRLQKANLSGEFADALKYALGADNINIGSTTALWVAAARARHPFEDDLLVNQRHPSTGPDGACVARYEIQYITQTPEKKRTWQVDHSFRLLKRSPAMPAEKQKINTLPVLRHKIAFENFVAQKYSAWSQSAYPINSEAYFAEGVERICSHDGQDSIGKLNNVFLESVYDSDIPVTRLALIMLVLAISSKQKDEHALGIEALIAAVEDGRLGGTRLGALMREMFCAQGKHPRGSWNQEYVPLVSSTRWAKALKPIALASPYHGYAVRLALLEFLRGDAKLAPRDVHLMLEMLLELLMNDGDVVSSDDTRNYLTELGKLVPSGKTAKLVKQLLALKQTALFGGRRAEIVRYALERRLERAERWTQWKL